MRKLSQIIGVGPVKSQGLYKKKAGESEKEVGRCYASGFKMGPQAKKCKQPLESGKGNEIDLS